MCEMEGSDFVAAAVASIGELAVIREQATKDPPESSRKAASFELVENTKELLLDPVGDLGTSLDRK